MKSTSSDCSTPRTSLLLKKEKIFSKTIGRDIYDCFQQQNFRETELQSLDSVFIDDDLKDDIITRTAIPQLIEGTVPSGAGVILFGPPGTGKTSILRAIGMVYQAMGAYTKMVSVSAIDSSYHAKFSQNLEDEILISLQEADKRKKPSFLFFDEGSLLVQSAEKGTSGSKHYQEAIDTLKRYVGNTKYLVIGISTNLESDSFDEALTREGRLTPVLIGYPNVEQREKMWRYFVSKYSLMDLASEQAHILAAEFPEKQGAFIEDFTRNYKRNLRSAILKEKGYASLVSALKQGARISDSEVCQRITFDRLYADVGAVSRKKCEISVAVPALSEGSVYN